MPRPSFQFYPGDWLRNAKLRYCTHEELGVWINFLCLAADEDEFGVIRRPLQEIARALKCHVKVLRSLVAKGVLKGADDASSCDAFTYTPRSGRVDGPTVTLIQEQDGPLWYSSRMVRDEYIARMRAGHARMHGGVTTDYSRAPKPSPKRAPLLSPMGGFGDDEGDLLSSSSSSSIKSTPPSAVAFASPAREPDPIFGTGLALLVRKGCVERGARAFLGKMRRDFGDGVVLEVLERADREDVAEPIPWIRKALEARAGGPATTKRKGSTEPDFAQINYRVGVNDDGSF
jgi:hypothetical protein